MGVGSSCGFPRGPLTKYLGRSCGCTGGCLCGSGSFTPTIAVRPSPQSSPWQGKESSHACCLARKLAPGAAGCCSGDSQVQPLAMEAFPDLLVNWGILANRDASSLAECRYAQRAPRRGLSHCSGSFPLLALGRRLHLFVPCSLWGGSCWYATKCRRQQSWHLSARESMKGETRHGVRQIWVAKTRCFVPINHAPQTITTMSS